MLLSLCLLLHALSPSNQEICSSPGALPAPTLYLSQTSAQKGDSVLFQCAVLSQLPRPATRIVFCKDGKEISSQRGLKEKVTYNYDHAVSRGSSGNYSCGYEIKDNNNQLNRSQLNPAQHLSITGKGDEQQGSVSSSRGGEEPTHPGPDMLFLIIWASRCTLVLLLLLSAPVITFMLEKWGLPQPAGLEENPEESRNIMGERGAGIPIEQL